MHNSQIAAVTALDTPLILRSQPKLPNCLLRSRGGGLAARSLLGVLWPVDTAEIVERDLQKQQTTDHHGRAADEENGQIDFS